MNVPCHLPRPAPIEPEPEAEAVRAAIRRQLDDLATWPYDDDGPAPCLPVRPDARQYLGEVLCAAGHGALDAGDLPPPTLELNDDGTLTLHWIWRHHYLAVDIPCGGIVRARRRNTASGLLIAETYRNPEAAALAARLAALFDWLRQADGGSPPVIDPNPTGGNPSHVST